jgi:TctA family transporter
MNRCAQFSLAATIAATLVALAPAVASAQSATTDGQALRRNFPKEALRGTIVFFAPPAIALNGVDTQMAPSYRIHGTNNLLVMSSQLNGLKATVDYTVDVQGAVREVWILSPDEAAKTWPTTAAQAAAWTFDAIAQTWTKP